MNLNPASSFQRSPNTIPAIPTFTSTSSPEIDTLFLDFREKVFTPAALAQHHRDLIYKKSRHPILLNDPGVTVTLSNDEDIKLQPMEPRDRPNKRKSLSRLAVLLGDGENAEAWTNLPAFLEGMEIAKEKLPIKWMQKITRKANMTGKTGVIKLCAEMVKKTGASLALPLMTRELMLGYHMQAVKGGFQGEELEKALKSAEQITLMMEDKLHCAGKLKPWHVDMRKDPTVLGVLLELTAYKAINIDGGEDVDGKVASLVTKSLACIKDRDWAAQGETAAKNLHGYASQSVLEWWIPLWNGLKTALDISSISNGPNANDLRSAKVRLEEALRSVEKSVEETSEGQIRRCLNMLVDVGARSS